jgi:hypothetical protein
MKLSKSSRAPRRLAGGRSFVPSLAATVVGGVMIAFGGLTVTATSALGQPSDTQAADSSTCTSDPVVVDLQQVTVNGATATVSYTITGCVGSDRVHVHENLLAAPTAGSDPQHQANYNFDITVDSPTQQTVPLLDGIPGKCWIQFDYSTARERHGAFIRTPTCPSESSSPPSSSSPPPSSSSAPSSSGAPSPSPVSTTPPVSSSSAAASTAVSPSSASAPANSSEVVAVGAGVAPSQLGPIPQTGFDGTLPVRQSHPYAWMIVVGGALLLLGLADLVRRLPRRRRVGAA